MKLFSLLESLLQKAEYSSSWRVLLTLLLPWIIPFNARHGYALLQIGRTKSTRIAIPHRRSNYNHLSGIHACSLATGAELCSGLSILQHFPPSRYRIIMAQLQCTYTYQARKDCVAEVSVITDAQKESVAATLSKEDKATLELPVLITDSDNQVVAEVVVHWQIKAWSAVRT